MPGETPIDVSGLKRKGISTRAELNEAEAENIRKAVDRLRLTWRGKTEIEGKAVGDGCKVKMAECFATEPGSDTKTPMPDARSADGTGQWCPRERRHE
jgi:hypothetical protein